MNISTLKYVVALAREKHFGKAAMVCGISQPTLSIAIKKFEEELHVKLFERTKASVTLTPLGEDVLSHAQVALEQADAIAEIARRGEQPIARPLKVGVIHTIGPYLLPEVMRKMMRHMARTPLLLREGPAGDLVAMLRTGELDGAILCEPVPFATLRTAPLYDEPLVVAVPVRHALASQGSVRCEELKRETVLLPGEGDCFREHVLKMFPDLAEPAAQSVGQPRGLSDFSLEIIKHMVASGVGVTILPRLSAPVEALHDQPGERNESLIKYLPLENDAPMRRVVLAWRQGFPHEEAITCLLNAVHACDLPGVMRLKGDVSQSMNVFSK
jgi:LysR family hydrogen peroxide-inducible transcriptional activator